MTCHCVDIIKTAEQNYVAAVVPCQFIFLLEWFAANKQGPTAK